MKSLKDFNYLLSLDRRYTKTESEIFRAQAILGRKKCKAPDLSVRGLLVATVDCNLRSVEACPLKDRT